LQTSNAFLKSPVPAIFLAQSSIAEA